MSKGEGGGSDSLICLTLCSAVYPEFSLTLTSKTVRVTNEHCLFHITGIISPYKDESSISAENHLGVREKSLVRAAEPTPQNTEGKQTTQQDR